MKYYVYIYLNPLKKGEFNYNDFKFGYLPFYIGRGKEDRITKHLCKSIYNEKGGNRLKNNIIKKIIRNNKSPIYLKLYENLTYLESIKREVELINLIGRRDLNNGSLSNMTDGGEGSINRTWSKQQIKNMRIDKEVIQYDNMGNIINIWESAGEAGKKLNIHSPEIHRKCRKDKLLRLGGYFWKYRSTENINDIIEISENDLPILQYNLNGEFQKRFDDSKMCSKHGYHSGHVLRVCRDNKDNKDNYYENMFAEYIWTFQYNTSIKNKIYPYKRNLKNNMRVNKKIFKYSLSDEYLGSFHTYELRDHGFKTKTILMCCNNKLKTSQGFTWKFEISEKFSDII